MLKVALKLNDNLIVFHTAFNDAHFNERLHIAVYRIMRHPGKLRAHIPIENRHRRVPMLIST